MTDSNLETTETLPDKARIEVRLERETFNVIRRLVLRQKEAGIRASMNSWIVDACIQRLESDGETTA